MQLRVAVETLSLIILIGAARFELRSMSSIDY